MRGTRLNGGLFDSKDKFYGTEWEALEWLATFAKREHDRPFDIADGTNHEWNALRKFGHNDDVGATFEDIWDGQDTYTYLTAAEKLKIQGGVNDTNGGTGAWTVRLFGLDGDYNNITEDVTMNGVAFVETTQTFLRIYRAFVLTAGSAGTNVAAIDAYQNDETTLQLRIKAAYGQTLHALWTVPNGKRMYITSWYSSTNLAKAVETNLFIRTIGGAWRVQSNIHHLDGVYKMEFEYPLVLEAKTDIAVRGNATGGGGAISAGFTGIYKSV